MSETPFIEIYARIEEARNEVSKAMQKTRELRGVALGNNDLPMSRLLKEIEFILKKVLED